MVNKIKIIYKVLIMVKNYTNIYNNFITLTSNKSLYKGLNQQDEFSDRLVIFLLHFAFFFKIFKNKNNENLLQNIYDFSFRQLELSIREIGYGDQSINKKMKNYINIFHGIISEVHFWDQMKFAKKKFFLSNFLYNFEDIDYLIQYFEEFSTNLKKYDLNSYLKSVNKS
jgi:cytochrome b pre-mRNA-processing protein 3